MRRADTTSAEHQRTYRGRHLPADGRSGYSGTGARYLRCSCGWRLVNITFRQRVAARTAHGEHVRERQAERAQQTGH